KAPEQEQPAKQESTQQGGSSDSGGSGGGAGETVTMPAPGESVTEGIVTRWLKAEGDTVEVDEPLLEVSTDKVDTEIPSPVAGVLSKIIAAEDATVEVGGALCVIGGEAGGSDSSAAPASEPAAEEAPAQQEPEQAKQPESKDEPAAETDGGLAQEQDVQKQAAQESEAKSDPGASTGATEDESEDAVGLGTMAGDNGSTSHKDTSDVGSASQDVSAYVTPLVRKLAAQHGVDLSSLTGTGVGGRIRKQDVLDAAKASEEAAKKSEEDAKASEEAAKNSEAAAAPAAQSPAAAPSTSAPSASAPPTTSTESTAKRGTTEKMSRLRKVIATRMVESLQNSAQLTTVIEVDVTKVARLRNRSKADFLKREGAKLSFMPFFAMAAIEALKEHPIVNASVEGDTIVYHAAEHLGVAVDTPRGLLVPVIKDAGNLNIAGLAHKIADLAERTRDNKVTPDELSGGTFTLTNTGSRGALFDTPIINMPNVAILGTGAVVKRPVVVTDEDGGATIAIRDMVYLAISYDHRVVDGADAARFLTSMKQRLEDGNFEV
ncbi:MAG: 2-oxo acid dehydrogenase subunit E2, partial [Ornithinimicrobium sp.]|uniref:2-oxo acid dehydrogenase subunit E2 n=1 Tax=Ornithinimicrobium sp. TaxID=1977084 RepID=UPI0026E110F9